MKKDKYRTKSIDEMDLDEVVAWSRGYLLLAIGRGDFQNAVWTVVSQAYGKGKQDGKEIQK